MSKIIGVGGVFLQFKGDDQEIRDWYESNLGLSMSPYGTNFIHGDQLTLVSFTRSDTPTTPTINFRVDDLEDVIHNLRQTTSVITKEIEEFSYGKFAQFKDPFGNYIELWEPNIEEYRKMVEQKIIEYEQKKSTK